MTVELEHHPIFDKDQISLCKKHTFVCLATHMQSQHMRGTVALVETVVRETTPISQSTKPLKATIETILHKASKKRGEVLVDLCS